MRCAAQVRILSILAVGLLFIACSQRAVKPGDGRIVGKVYTNEFFAVSLTLPPEWVECSQQAIKNHPSVEVLLFGKVREDVAFMIMHQDYSHMKNSYTGRDVLAWVEETRKPTSPPLERLEGIDEVTVGKREFYRVKFRTPRQHLMMEQVYYATVWHQHSLVFAFTGLEGGKVAEAEKLLQTVKFEKPS